jgi:hypothetical protein
MSVTLKAGTLISRENKLLSRIGHGQDTVLVHECPVHMLFFIIPAAPLIFEAFVRESFPFQLQLAGAFGVSDVSHGA